MEDIALTKDAKGYAVLAGEDTDINFFVQDQRGEYDFRFRPSNPQELLVRCNEEMGESFKDMQCLWTNSEALMDFMLSHAPAN